MYYPRWLSYREKSRKPRISSRGSSPKHITETTIMSFARFLLVPSIAGLTYSLKPRPLSCDYSSPISSLKTQRTGPLIDPHQFATGSILGITAGLIFRRLGKIFFIIVGGSYLLLRSLRSSSLTIPGLDEIPFSKIRRFLLNKSQLGEAADSIGGRVEESRIRRFVGTDTTFKASFLATFMIGLINT